MKKIKYFENFENSDVSEIVLSVRNRWIDEFGHEEALERAMYSGCDEFSYQVIKYLKENSIEFDLLNSVTYTKRVGGISGFNSLIKQEDYKNWYSKLPKNFNKDEYFKDYEFPHHEWLYVQGKHYDFVDYKGVSSVFEMSWIKDHFAWIMDR